MPVIKSAKKKLRQDKNRQAANKEIKVLLKDLIHDAKKTKAPKTIIAAVKTADKAAKKHIIHKNKAARIKSMLSTLTPTTKSSQAAS